VTCAVAAALVEMAAGFSGAAGADEAAGVRAAVLRDRALLAARMAERASRHVVGDATTAAVLAEAACRAAAVLVALNLRGALDERPTQAAEWAGDADVARRSALSKAHES